VDACVGGEKQRSLDALFYFPHPAEVDQESAVDAEESFAFKLLLKAIKASGSGPEPSLIARQPDIVVVSLGEADLAGVEENPSIFPQGDDPAGERAGVSGAEQGITRGRPEGGMPAGRPKGKQHTNHLSSGEDRADRDRDRGAEEGHEDLR
jgi:hypothetical protein